MKNRLFFVVDNGYEVSSLGRDKRKTLPDVWQTLVSGGARVGFYKS